MNLVMSFLDTFQTLCVCLEVLISKTATKLKTTPDQGTTRFWSGAYPDSRPRVHGQERNISPLENEEE